MTIIALPDLAKRQFRAGGAFELVLFDRLPPEEQLPLAELRADSEFYGVLRPRPGSGYTVRAVDKNTALLWLTLQSPGPLPSFVWAGETEKTIKAVNDLILDGVLEIEEGGQFLSGAAAARLSSRESRGVPEGRLVRLSCDALRYGESLQIDDPQQLAVCLYLFGRQPLTPTWWRRLAEQGAVLDFLRASPGSGLDRRFESYGWKMAVSAKPSGWIVWSRLERQDASAGTPVCKLYVSPMMEALPEVFEVVVDTLSRGGGTRFKVGSDAGGLLRPDKLVLYFESLERLLAVATELAAKLAGAAPHGVPFSAEIAHDGLLSWGMDPPADARVLGWQEHESWRLWIVRRLAAAMVAAQRNETSKIPPWQFALERLRQIGVDVDRWTPSPAIWRTA